MINLKLIGMEAMMGPYQNIIVLKNNGLESNNDHILFKGCFLELPSNSDIVYSEISCIRTNEENPDTIIIEVEYNES